MEIKEDLIRRILTRNEKLKELRNPWLTLWDEAMDFVCPQHGSLKSGFSRQQGEKRGTSLYDGTPSWAADVMVSGLYSGLVADNSKWFKWNFMPLRLNEIPIIRGWAEQCEDATYLALNDSNYGDATMTTFEHLVHFGTGVKYSEYHSTKILNFCNVGLDECVFAENRLGIVDTLFREFKWSARNAYKEWGKKLPAQILQAVESGNMDDEFKFLHAVFPREDYNPGKADKLNMPFASLWISLDGEQKLLEEGGYRTFPYSVPRMYKMLREVYGRGPAIRALVAMGALNAMALVNLTAGQRMVEPALQYPDDGTPKWIDLSPGAMNPYSPGKGEIKPIMTGLNVPFGLEMQQREEQAVQRWFHTDVFLALTMADSRMTATEVLERKQEKLLLLGPTIGRQKREHLDSDLDRVFSILLDNGYYPPPPDELLEMMQEMNTEYTSPMFLAQRRRDSDAVMGWIQKTSLIAQATQNLEVLDVIEGDEAARLIAERDVVPIKTVRSPDGVAKVRAIRAKRAQDAQMMQEGMAAVEAAKSLGQVSTNPEDPNVMGELLKGLSGGAA